MNTLYLEVGGCVVLAGLLGLGAGWMMQRAQAARRLRRTVSFWEKRCNELVPPGEASAQSLQDRLRTLDEVLAGETARTRELEAQLGATNSRLEKARGDAIRLNSQQAGIQERLQRIIRDKDQELAELARRLDRPTTRAASPPPAAAPAAAPARLAASAAPAAAPTGIAASPEIEAYIDRLSDRGERSRRVTQQAPATGAVTQARAAAPAATSRTGLTPITLPGASGEPRVARQAEPSVESSVERPTDHSDVPYDEEYDDTLDATAVIDMGMERHIRNAPNPEDSLDATSQEPLLFDEDTIAFEEDTIAFDDATLERVRQRSHKA